MENSDDTENEVGYGKPPKKHQFKPGQSGNKKGRKRGSRNFRSDLEEALKAKVSVTKDGKSVKMTTQQASIARLMEKSLKGDNQSMSKLFDLILRHLPDDVARTDEGRLTKPDLDILKAYEKNLVARGANDG